VNNEIQEQRSSEANAVAAQEINMLDVLLLLARYWQLLVFVPFVAGLIGLAASFAITPKFTSSAQIMVPQSGQGGSLGGLVGAAGVSVNLGSGLLPGLKNPADQWVGLLSSRTIADAMLERFDLMKAYNSELRFQARDSLAANTRIQASKDGLISIEVDDVNPEKAAAMANGYIEELQILSNKLAVTEASQRRLFLEKQLGQTMERLKKAASNLRASGLNVDLLKLSPESAVDQLSRLRAEVASKEVQIAVMRNSMMDSNPVLQRALSELSALRRQLQKLDEPSAAQMQQSAGYADAYRDYKYQEALYELLVRQLEIARADEAREGAVIQVVDPAVTPEWKSSPRRGFMAVAAAAAGLLAALLFMIVHAGMKHYRTDPANANKLKQLLG
jgi:tyrosine-protein kinase Etk/Wzc